MTPAPIPEWFNAAIKENRPKVDIGLDAEDYANEVGVSAGFVRGAKWAYRLLASQQTMRWVKCTERLPPDVNKRYAARVKSMFGSDPILCVIKRSGSDSWLAGPIAGDYPSVTTESIIEWLDESPAPIQ